MCSESETYFHFEAIGKMKLNFITLLSVLIDTSILRLYNFICALLRINGHRSETWNLLLILTLAQVMFVYIPMATMHMNKFTVTEVVHHFLNEVNQEESCS